MILLIAIGKKLQYLRPYIENLNWFLRPSEFLPLWPAASTLKVKYFFIGNLKNSSIPVEYFSSVNVNHLMLVFFSKIMKLLIINPESKLVEPSSGLHVYLKIFWLIRHPINPLNKRYLLIIKDFILLIHNAFLRANLALFFVNP